MCLYLLDGQVVDVENHPMTQRNQAEFAEAEVDIRDFAKFSYCSLLNPSRVICCKLSLTVFIAPKHSIDLQLLGFVLVNVNRH